jgi:hypothetical protein
MGGRQTATCDEKTPSAKRTQEQRERHEAYEAVTTVRSFGQAQAGRRAKVQSGRYSSRDFAVAADKTMSLRNVP